MKTTLGDICDLYQPKTISADMLIPDGEYLVYGANGVIGRFNQYNHIEEEVLLTCRGATCGSINLSKPYSWINGNAMVVHPKSTATFCSRSFLVYLLKSIDFSKVITGAAQPQITRQSLAPVVVSIPLLPEQERIVAELDLLSGIIDKYKQQLKELDTLAQSIFYDMFGDPVANEKGWVVKKLGDITQIGSSRRVFINEVVEQGVPFLRGTEIRALSEGEVLHSTLFITEEHYKRLKDETGIPDIGDLLLASICFDGQIWLVNTRQPFYFKDGRVLWVHFTNHTPLSGQYTRFFLREKFIREYDKVASGTTFSELKIISLKTLHLPVPPLALQQSFAEKIEAIEKQKESVKQAIKETETLFNGRMDYYFN
ncbi:MAG: restriction endonuclease subunit S [Bacteroidales bacterium]|nr:restriction endonuclease subunit S [Bacteroidales bacterium]